mmetsp:Transcript_2206/g.4076  ORF Transcript_2206/g.4076 Transcript_2206/m.4076 type:complete len:92 (-) Transcript_2206:165-440(-)
MWNTSPRINATIDNRDRHSTCATSSAPTVKEHQPSTTIQRQRRYSVNDGNRLRWPGNLQQELRCKQPKRDHLVYVEHEPSHQRNHRQPRSA